MKKTKVETVETRKRIVQVASKMFLEQGLAATGITEIMQGAGMTQGGFYRHFASKEQLVGEASEAAYDQIYTIVDKEVAGLSPRDTLDKLVHMYLFQRQRKVVDFLCPLVHLGSELPHADDNVKGIVNSGYKRMVGYIAGLVQQLGVPDNTAVAEAIVSSIVGAVTISRLAPTETSSKAILSNAEKSLDLILQAAMQRGARP